MPTSAFLNATIAGLYELLSAPGSGGIAGACTPATPNGSGWVLAESLLGIVSTAEAGAGTTGTTQSVSPCDSAWALTVAQQVRVHPQ